MISLKRNQKTKELVSATGITSQKWRIYTPFQNKEFKISRSRFDDYMTCKRCFYLKTNRGLMSPSTPGWTLNTLTDTLLKKEFDKHREGQTPHRLLVDNNLSHIVPFKHPNIDEWRDSTNKGIKLKYKDTNIILQGGVDDVWFNTLTDEIIIADYKSQHKNKEVNQSNYFSDPYKDGNKMQLDFYAYLFKGNGFKVSSDSYLYICNALEIDDGFHGKMNFDEILIHHPINTDYLEENIESMISCMNSENVPDGHSSCENCAYARQRSIYDDI